MSDLKAHQQFNLGRMDAIKFSIQYLTTELDIERDSPVLAILNDKLESYKLGEIEAQMFIDLKLETKAFEKRGRIDIREKNHLKYGLEYKDD